jgi:hypothetical protein
MTPELQARILSATLQTQLGAILAYALGDDCYDEGPHFVGRASVTFDGYVMCDFVTRDGEYEHGAFVGALATLDRNLQRLAKHLNLNAADLEQLLAAVAGWIATDWRPSARAAVEQQKAGRPLG